MVGCRESAHQSLSVCEIRKLHSQYNIFEKTIGMYNNYMYTYVYMMSNQIGVCVRIKVKLT